MVIDSITPRYPLLTLAENSSVGRETALGPMYGGCSSGCWRINYALEDVYVVRTRRCRDADITKEAVDNENVNADQLHSLMESVFRNVYRLLQHYNPTSHKA